jgi:hypothetical protein
LLHTRIDCDNKTSNERWIFTLEEIVLVFAESVFEVAGFASNENGNE